jgi:hypothetical protein
MSRPSTEIRSESRVPIKDANDCILSENMGKNVRLRKIRGLAIKLASSDRSTAQEAHRRLVNLGQIVLQPLRQMLYESNDNRLSVRIRWVIRGIYGNKLASKISNDATESIEPLEQFDSTTEHQCDSGERSFDLSCSRSREKANSRQDFLKLLRQLDSRDPEVAIEAYRKLVSLGESYLAELRRIMIQSKDCKRWLRTRAVIKDIEKCQLERLLQKAEDLTIQRWYYQYLARQESSIRKCIVKVTGKSKADGAVQKLVEIGEAALPLLYEAIDLASDDKERSRLSNVTRQIRAAIFWDKLGVTITN